MTTYLAKLRHALDQSPTSRLLLRHSFYPLCGCTAVCMAILISRLYLMRSFSYAFLVWNLFLAWIPWACAFSVLLLRAKYPAARASRYLVAFLWLIFFPNAPYIVTDFVHLYRVRTQHPWFDIGLLMTFAWTGCFLGVSSLQMMQGIVRQHVGRVAGWAFVLIVTLLSGIGIYIGRELRLNSWDLILRPYRVLSTLASPILHPFEHQKAIGFSLLFAAFTLVCYLTIPAVRVTDMTDTDRRMK